MTSVWFIYRVDDEPSEYQSKLVTDVELSTKGRFLHDYVVSIVSYAVGKYRKQNRLPDIMKGVIVSRLSHSPILNSGLSKQDIVSYDFCFQTREDVSTCYFYGKELHCRRISL